MKTGPIQNPTYLSHALCVHERTPAGRAACRAEIAATRYRTPAGRVKGVREPRTLRLLR